MTYGEDELRLVERDTGSSSELRAAQRLAQRSKTRAPFFEMAGAEFRSGLLAGHHPSSVIAPFAARVVRRLFAEASGTCFFVARRAHAFEAPTPDRGRGT